MAYPLSAGAQQKAMPAIGKAEPGSRVPIVGVLLPEPPEPFAGFHEKFRELGYEEGRNVRLEIRSADAQSERLPGLAAELVRMKVDVIILAFSPPTRVAIDATKQIPIVMTSVDPLVGGFVTNLSHPGGNVTGVAGFTCETAAKWLQLLKEAVPTAAASRYCGTPTGVALRAPSVMFKRPSAPRSRPASRFVFFFCAPTMIRFRPLKK